MEHYTPTSAEIDAAILRQTRPANRPHAHADLRTGRLIWAGMKRALDAGDVRLPTCKELVAELRAPRFSASASSIQIDTKPIRSVPVSADT